MKIAHCVLAGFLLSAVVVQGQNQDKNPRLVKPFMSFVKAGTFLEMKEAERTSYTTGLMDGFLASGLWGASNETMAGLISCTRDMDVKQVSAIIAKYVQGHPETWHLALSAEAFNALRTSCPGGLPIIDRKLDPAPQR